jgi:hypothetical protein
MKVPFPSQRSRATLGVLLILVAASATAARARANAQHHAAHARRARDTRWTLTGNATQGILGALLGLTLVVARRRPDAR